MDKNYLKKVSVHNVIISEISNRKVKVFEEIYIPIVSIEQLSHFIDNVIFEIEECGNGNFTNYRLKQLKWILKKLKSSLKSEKFNHKGYECVSVKNYPVSIFNLIDNIFQNSFYEGSKYSNIEYFICH